LIRLLIADIVPEVWVPPAEVRELRGMISYRNRLVKMGTMVRNRLQSLLHRHNILLPKGRLVDAAWQAGTEGEYVGEAANPAGTGDAG
jgi:transposase